MKKLLIPILLFISYLPAEAQLLKKIEQSAKRATERVVERKTEEKVEEKVESVFDSIFAKKKENDQDSTKAVQTSSDTERNEVDYSGFNPFGGNAEYEDSYSFYMQVVIRMEDYEEKEPPMEMTQAFGEDCMSIITEETEGGSMIMDFKNKSAVMVNEEEKTVQAFSLDMMSKFKGKAEPEPSADDIEDIDIVKTGKTKTILGYTCYEYIMNNEDGKMVSWHAPDVKFDYIGLMENFTDLVDLSSNLNIAQQPEMPQGYLMEMTMFKPDGSKQSHYEVISIDENNRTIDLDGYSVQKF